MISPEIDQEEKRRYLQAFSNKDYSQRELTYLSRALIHTMYDPQPYYPEGMCVCGTGGDRSNSFNISTTVSFIVASAGVPVIKHGNKSITSASGSTDLLAAMAHQYHASGSNANAASGNAFSFLERDRDISSDEAYSACS